MGPGRTAKNLMKEIPENYGRSFKNFLEINKINIDDYDAIIGPEYLNGGKQLCIRRPALQQEVLGHLTIKSRVTVTAGAQAKWTEEPGVKAKTLAAPKVKTLPGQQETTVPKVRPKMQKSLGTLRGRVGATLKGGAVVGATILISVLTQYYKSRLEQEQISEDLEELEPEIQDRLAEFTPAIQTYLDKAPGAEVYAVITVRLKHITSFVDEDFGYMTTYAGLDLISVSWSGDKKEEQKSAGFDMYFPDKWEYTDTTFSVPLEM